MKALQIAAKLHQETDQPIYEQGIEALLVIAMVAVIALLLSVTAVPAVLSPGATEVSEVSAAPVHALRVILPAGTAKTLRLHNVQEPKVEAPDGVRAETFWLWGDLRPFVEGGDRFVPMWLLPWRVGPRPDPIVRLHADKPGEYVVPVAEGVTVNLEVTQPLPKPDIGLGFYNPFTWPKPEEEPLIRRSMRDHLLNVFTPRPDPVHDSLPHAPRQDNTAARIAWRIDAAIEEGLIGPKHPLLWLSVCPEDIVKAKLLARYPDRWPPLVCGNVDEPGLHREKLVRQYAGAAHKLGVLSGTAIPGYSIMAFGDVLDMWILNIEQMNEEIRRRAQEQGAWLWVYTSAMRGTNAPIHRYLTGLWAWAVRPEGVLVWAFAHDLREFTGPQDVFAIQHSHAVAGPDGPIDSVGIEGMRDGAIDYMLLRHLEQLVAHPNFTDAEWEDYYNLHKAAQWLEQLRASVPPHFWPHGTAYWPTNIRKSLWDGPDTQNPPVASFSHLRAKAWKYISEIEQQ